jgi:integrase
MKAGHEHRVPLSNRAIEILRALPREPNNPNIFVGSRAGGRVGDLAMYRTLRCLRMGVTVHGFRSTFSTWAHEQTGYAAHVIEQALAHSVGSAVERAYRRSDLFEKRRRLMDDWAKYCAAPVADPKKVIPLRGTA